MAKRAKFWNYFF